MKTQFIYNVLLLVAITASISFAQPTPITAWPYYYDWTGASDFVMSADNRTYVGGDGQWSTYDFLSFGSTYRQFSAYLQRVNSSGRGAATGNDTLFAVVDARTRSFTGSEVLYISTARASSAGTYSANDYLRVYINNTLLKSVLITNLSYVGDSLTNLTVPIPISVQRTMFTIKLIVEDYSHWSATSVVFDNISFPNAPLPITLSSFGGSYNTTSNCVNLSWFTSTEVANYGFEVHRRINDSDFEMIGFVPGAGTTIEPRTYVFNDRSLPVSGQYLYRLVQVDLDGTRHSYDDNVVTVSVSAPTGVDHTDRVEVFSLLQNYPNPWNPSTTIRYSIPRNSFVTLTLYSSIGEEVLRLVNEQQTPGVHDVVLHGDGLASGLYMYRLSAGEYVATRKLLLLR